MASLAPFLPPHLVRSLARNGPPAGLPHVERFPAALLLSDISGFTALTERLQAKGREGAEEVAGLVSTAFGWVIDAIEAHHGSIQSFGGDALFSIFPGPGAASRAIAAAEAIRDAFEQQEDRSSGPSRIPLGITQAIHHGDVSGIHVGTRRRCHYLIVGTSVTAVARLQQKARSGAIRISAEAARRARRERPPRALRRVRGERARPSILRTYLPERLASLVTDWEGAYRKVAVLFLETKGRSPSALNAFYLALCEALDDYEGVLLKTDLSPFGTKWLCAFGIPAAHEEDPERAAGVALSLRSLRRIAFRGGLHAGTVANVIVGTASRRSFDVMGDVVNTAARALTCAAWGEVLVTERTRRSLAGTDTASRGRHAVKGKATTLELHAIVGSRATASRIRVSAPLVGREAELQTLRVALARAGAGEGRVIGIKADPGLGKSRLKWEAAEIARRAGFEVHEGRAQRFGGMSYGAIADLLRHALQIPEEPQAALAGIERACVDLGLGPVDRHHLADVLGHRAVDSPLAQLDGETIRLNNKVAIASALSARALRAPLLLVIEDMHWTDAATREAIEWLSRKTASARILLLLLYRPDYRPPVSASEMALRELPPDAVAAMLGALLGAVPDSIGVLIRERAGGNPLYVEEVIHHLLESGAIVPGGGGHVLVREPRSDDVPETIEALIETRLDALSREARRVAQIGSVIGRVFMFELLAHFEEVGPSARSAIEELMAREIVFEHARDTHLSYAFKHALTRDLAYAGILTSRRRKLHGEVAVALEELFPSAERDAHVAMLGHHWEQAGDRDRAKSYYLAGARHAASRYAHGEAERLYRATLALSDEGTAVQVDVENELGSRVLAVMGRTHEAEVVHRSALVHARALADALRVADSLQLLAFTLVTTQQHPEAETHLREALGLARDAGARRIEGQVFHSLAQLHFHSGRPEEARRLGRAAVRIARELQNPTELALALLLLAGVDMDQGKLAGAERLQRAAGAAYRQAGNRRGQGHALVDLGTTLFRLGRWEEGQRLYEDALAILRDVGDRRLLAATLCNMASALESRLRPEEAVALLEEALAICSETNDRAQEGMVLVNLGYQMRQLGRIGEARGFYQKARERAEETGYLWLLAFVTGSQADLDRLTAGDVEAAARMLDECELMSERLGDPLFLGMAQCVRGHLNLSRGQSARENIARARETAERVGVGAESQLAMMIGKLERATLDHEAGRPLFRGERVEELSPGLRRYFEERGDLSE